MFNPARSNAPVNVVIFGHSLVPQGKDGQQGSTGIAADKGEKVKPKALLPISQTPRF